MTAQSSASFPEYDYALPDALIATHPTAERRLSRLLLADLQGGPIDEAAFADLPRLLRRGDLLVVNDSRVLPARMIMHRPGSATGEGGGRVEILLVRPETDDIWLTMARPARRLRGGDLLLIGEAEVEVVSREADGYLRLRGRGQSLSSLAQSCGEMPLPPYIEKRRAEADPRDYDDMDRERYQTVYADQGGSVAAPTAGLHFDDRLLADLAAAGVGLAKLTLHVGPGTFRPPSEADFAARRLHAEAFCCPAPTYAALRRTRAAGGRIIAVGTTSLRVLETIAGLGLEEQGPDRRDFGVDDPRPVFQGTAHRDAGSADWEIEGSTRLFIAPPDRIESVDALITNFHLPGSSLLMLVASFLGNDRWRPVYDHAVRHGFRFYSYGDAMLIEGRPAAQTRREDP